MKILVLGLDCATPELLLGDPALVHIRHLMGLGCYGRLESVIPPITVPAWMCLATGLDPGTLGVYGFRNRERPDYAGWSTVNSRSIQAMAIWDHLAREGRRSVLVGVPPSYPPRRIHGVCVGCFLTPNTAPGTVYTHPPELAERIAGWVGDYPVDVPDFRTTDKDRLLAEVYRMSRAHFEVVRRLLAEEPWDYFHAVEIGLDRMHHGFWECHDPAHPRHDPNNPHREAIRDYYRYLDGELGSVLALLPEDVVVLVTSDHGARPLMGGFCVNDWLVREGLLVLREPVGEVTRFDPERVDWDRTTAWSEGGYYARIMINRAGREPRGLVAPADYDRVRDELEARILALCLPDGQPMGNRVFRPERIYHQVNGHAPDLLAYFGDLAWRSIGSLGHSALFVQENDTGPDGCNHAQFGAFVLAAPNLPRHGEVDGARLLDLAPTLLDLIGCEIPAQMVGRSLVAGWQDAPAALSEDEVVRERLRGLGYLGD